MKRRLGIAGLCLTLGVAPGAGALELANRTIEEAIEALEARGLSVLYSSDLIKPQMRVEAAPAATSPRAQLEEILAPHGVRVVEGPGGLLLLTRASRPPASAAMNIAPEPLQEVVVTASRYAWVRTPQLALTRLSEAELHLAPNVGDDPLRTLARLPGAAASDFSAKIYTRGGAADETLVRFDGLRLVNPFHLKDFQSVFSAIDPALVGAVDVYTGGFPVNFGDRMSGVIDIHPVRAETARRELALSLFHASAFGAGRFAEGRGDWAAAARRGNLDRVIDWSGLRLGDPSYSDVYLHVGHELGESMALAVNALGFDDDIELADSDVEERARARYRDRYAWLRLDAHPRESLVGTTLFARTHLESVRTGAADQPGIARGVLDDRREFTIDSLQSDWSWRLGRTALMQFGGEWRRSVGRYRYSDDAEFDLHFVAPGMQGADGGAHTIDQRRHGDQFGGYASVRVDVADPITLEGGLRLDRSTLSEEGWHASPRGSMLYRIDDSRLVRAGWGRFVQTRGIDELQISDGETRFTPAQRAEHWLLSFEQRLSPQTELRLEAYYKSYSRVAPRYENLLNTLVILPELKPDRMRIAPMSAKAVGFEASLRTLRSRPFFWWASYAWSRAEDELAVGDVQRGWDQEHMLHAGFGWENGHWELSLAGAWRSGWPTTTPTLVFGEDNEPIAFAARANADRLETYLDIDARVARRFPLQGDASLTVFFEINNALNRRNACCTEYELDDEAEQPTLVLETIRSVPLTPSLGVVWRF